MSDSMASPSVMIISDDAGLVDSLVSNNKTGQEFIARQSVQLVFDEPALFQDNSIVIYDIGDHKGELDAAIDHILKIKQLDPTQVIILTGESEALGSVLKSSIQPLVYRAFTKPVSANQVSLAFKSGNQLHFDLVDKQAAGHDITAVGPAENKTNVASLLGERKNHSVRFATIGIAVIALAAWFLLANDIVRETDTATATNLPRPGLPDTTVPGNPVTDKPAAEREVSISSKSVLRINELNQLAENALLEDNMIAPAGTSALDYYDQVLAIDPYDTTAYQGRKNISNSLRTSFQELVENAKFDRALTAMALLERLDPLNLHNDNLRNELEQAIDSHVKQIHEEGSAEDIAKTTEVLEKIEADFAGSRSAIDSLHAEKVLIAKIDAALDKELLVPPVKDNAYSLVSASMKNNTVSKVNISPRIKTLSEKLLRMANQSAAQNDVDEAQKLAALVKRLNVDRKGLAKLNSIIGQKVTAMAVAAEKLKETEIVVPEPAKIIPAKIIKRPSPRYPHRALSQNIEGWVEVSFQIDKQGLPKNIAVLQAEPSGIFESSALQAVKKWRFSPAKNEQTGLAVEGDEMTTTLRFKFE